MLAEQVVSILLTSIPSIPRSWNHPKCTCTSLPQAAVKLHYVHSNLVHAGASKLALRTVKEIDEGTISLTRCIKRAMMSLITPSIRNAMN